MVDKLQVEKWEGKVSIDVSVDEIHAWSLLSDFFSLHLWLPGIATCEKVTGTGSVPGSIRYVASPANESGEVSWAKEELIGFDSKERKFSYRVVDSNMGFGEYVGQFRVLPGMKDDGCRLEWSFECEPVNGWSREGLLGYIDFGLKGMAERIEKAINPDGKKTTHEKINYEANDKHDGNVVVNGGANYKANDGVKGDINCEVNAA